MKHYVVTVENNEMNGQGRTAITNKTGIDLVLFITQLVGCSMLQIVGGDEATKTVILESEDGVNYKRIKFEVTVT